MEGVLFEASKVKGWQWCQEPLWTTWSLQKFGEIQRLHMKSYPEIKKLIRLFSVICTRNPRPIPPLIGHAYTDCSTTSESLRLF